MHKPLKAKKLYNLRKAAYVHTSRLTRKSRTTYSNPLTFRKVVHKCAPNPYNLWKPHTIAHPDCYRRLRKNQQVDFKRHDMQQERQVHTSSLWLEKNNKGKFTYKSQRLNGKVSSIVNRGRWPPQTVSAHRFIQWGFNSRQAKKSAFWIIRKTL